MELSILLLKKIIVLLIMILMGFFTVKSGKVKSSDSVVVSNLCFDWVIPCSLINAFQTPYNAEKAKSFLFACGAAVFCIILFIVITRLIQRPLKFNKAEQGTAIFSNSAGIGAPLISSVLGPEALFYCAAHMGFQNFFIFTYLPFIMSKNAKADWKKILLNRNVLSIFVGLALFFTGFQLPEILSTAVKTIGGLLSPLSMLMIGMLMGGVDFKKVLREKRLYLVCFARLIIYPLIFMLIIRLSGINAVIPYAREVLLIVLIAASAPAAALVTQLSTLYLTEAEAQEAGSLNVMTTLFCVLTMPLIVWIYQMVC